MPENFFTLLNLPKSVRIDTDALEQSYRDLSKSCHPDSGGDTERFQTLTRARETLVDPVSRLQHVLDLSDYSSPQHSGQLSEIIATEFPTVAGLIEQTTALIKSLENAHSQLQKALLQSQVIKAQSALSDKQDQLNEIEADMLDRITDESTLEDISITVRDLAFIKRWRAQLQSQFAALWV